MSKIRHPPPWNAVRSNPYRVLFPLGLVVASYGTILWIAYALRLYPGYPVIEHALVMTQGFVCAAILGFLFTMLPRRTETAPPSLATLTVAATGLVGMTLFAAWGMWVASQLAWLASMLAGAGFVAPRLLRNRRAPPDSFVWLWAGFAFAFAGAFLAAAGGVWDDAWWAHELGQEWVKHGMLLSFVFAVAPLVVSVMVKGKGTTDSAPTRASRLARLGHVLAAMALAGSIAIETLVHEPTGLALRAAVAYGVIACSVRPFGRPARPGALRWAILVAFWCLPLGAAASAVFTVYRSGLMHVTYILGFALLVIAAGTQVVLGHEGMDRAKLVNPVPVRLSLVFVVLAAVARVLVQWDPTRATVWLVVASSLLVTASVGVVVPVVREKLAPRSLRAG